MPGLMHFGDGGSHQAGQVRGRQHPVGIVDEQAVGGKAFQRVGHL